MFSDMVSFTVPVLTVDVKLSWVASKDTCVCLIMYFSKHANDFDVSNNSNSSNNIELLILLVLSNNK